MKDEDAGRAIGCSSIMPSHCVGFNTKVPAQLRRNQEEPEERGEKNFTGKSTKDAKM
jgi:hypothetical protein